MSSPLASTPARACPQGHPSTEPDFCSECGLKLKTIADAEPLADPPEEKREDPMEEAIACPDCTSLHQMTWGQFCEVCGYNFSLSQSASQSAPQSTPQPAPQSASSTAPQQQSISHWTLTLSIDPSLWDPNLSPAPPDRNPEPLALQPGPTLIGRTSPTKAIYPDIALDFDNAVSQRHALLTPHPQQILVLRDLGSSNGTYLRGQPLTPLQDYPLHSGDSFTLGHWTRLTVTLQESP